MTSHLVVGAGTVGTLLATRLAERGHDVALASRSGSSAPGARTLQLDAADTAALSSASMGMDTIFLATSPTQYHRWESLWPPMFQAAIEAARASQAKLVMVGNLYAYGEDTTMPMTESSPLLTKERKGLVRKAGWELARQATERGDIRAVEVRASDYFGPGAGEYPGAWGRAWHVPTNAPLTRTQITDQVNQLTGHDASLKSYSRTLLRAIGMLSPSIRAANDSIYQVDKPFILDSSATERALEVKPTPWDDALAITVEWYRQNA